MPRESRYFTKEDLLCLEVDESEIEANQLGSEDGWASGRMRSGIVERCCFR